jgi:ubiquinone/menaquinone biosynthesis C-methylase UbiE
MPRQFCAAFSARDPKENYLPIVRAWDFSKYHAVADLGGGGGALIAAILKAFPNVRGMLVDRQQAIDAAAPRFESEGLGERCRLVAADREGVRTGADAYLMKHVLHGYADEAAIQILRHCRSVLPGEGRLLVMEFILPDVVDQADEQLERRLMSDLNMLAVTGGKERTAREWKSCRPVPGSNASASSPFPTIWYRSSRRHKKR